MRICLDSNFRDYYDHWFATRPCADDHIFHRRSRTEVHKFAQFFALEMLGFAVPPYGVVRTLVRDHAASALVVYTDPYAHAGEGKELLSAADAVACAPQAPASVYLGPWPPAHESTSLRYLGVGIHCWQLRYTGRGQGPVWRSNYAPEIEIAVHPDRDLFPGMVPNLPLWAIDEVVWQGRRYAVDLNTAPQIRGTGLEHLLPAEECYRLIEESIRYHRD